MKLVCPFLWIESGIDTALGTGQSVAQGQGSGSQQEPHGNSVLAVEEQSHQESSQESHPQECHTEATQTQSTVVSLEEGGGELQHLPLFSPSHLAFCGCWEGVVRSLSCCSCWKLW